MTISAVQIALQYYTSYKSDLEYSMMEIGNRRMVIAYRSSQLAQQAAADPEAVLADDPIYQALALQDKLYEQQMKTAETQQSMVAQLIQSYEKLLQQNIKDEFQISWGGQ